MTTDREVKGCLTMNDVLLLTETKKKGLLRFIFSRFFMIALLLLGQLILFGYFTLMLREKLPYYQVGMIAILIAGVMYLFNSRMDSSAKLTWLFIISLVPVAGVLMLAFTQTSLGHRKVKKKVQNMLTDSKDSIRQPEGVLASLSEDTSGTDALCRYVNQTNCFPIYNKTKTTYYPLGEDMFAAMLEDLKKARKYIFMEFFIIDEGYMWGSILRILADKAKEGVEVRVMYDGMLEATTLPYNYSKLLQEHGIKAKAYAPIRPIVSSHYNYRDHRKILVIDGNVAYTGGVNLADEYINRIERFGHWKDTGLRLEGDAVRSFTLMFLQMWNIREKEVIFEPWLSMQTEYDSAEQDRDPETPEVSASAEQCRISENAEDSVSADQDKIYGNPEAPASAEQDIDHNYGYVMPYGDCPLDEDKVGEMVYMDIFNRAVNYVHVMTPYLILDGELETAIIFAAQRGVDVKLILPGIPDKKMAYALAKSHYKRLVDAGVKIYEYTPGFVHAKIFVSDDIKAVAGTINLDYRSLYHHYECAVYMYKTPCIADMEKDFQNTLKACRQVTHESIRNEKAFYKVSGRLMKFIAPMM